MAAGQRDDGVAQPPGGLDVQVLGRLFSYILLLEALPGTDKMAEFLESIFLDTTILVAQAPVSHEWGARRVPSRRRSRRAALRGAPLTLRRRPHP